MQLGKEMLPYKKLIFNTQKVHGLLKKKMQLYLEKK